MNRIGLIGGTGPESTIAYYHDILYGAQERMGRPYFPELTIQSLSVFEVLRFCDEKDYDGLTDYLLAGIEKLAAAGASHAALTGVTPHIVYDVLQARSPIPVVSMVETVCAYVKERGYARVGIMATKPTMQADFFQKALRETGIEVVMPLASEQRYIGEKIETEMELGQFLDETKKGFRDISLRMITEEGLDALVLGCTELPILFRDITLPVPYVDAMRTHVEALIEIAMQP